MSLKNSTTKADFLIWEEAQSLILKLERDKNYPFAVLISCGVFLGLRVSDILTLKWTDLLNNDSLNIIEKKTQKARKIKISNNLKEIIKRIYAKLSVNAESQVILNETTNKPLTIQYLNRKLKEIRFDYKLKIQNFSTHTLRKTFGRHIWELYNYSEKSLILLSELFNHSSIAVTKRYLGIKQEELQAVYELL